MCYLFRAKYSGIICKQLTYPSGYIYSEILSKPATQIHSDRILDVVWKTIFLISVKPNHQIWLTFDKFATVKDRGFLTVKS